MVQSLSFKEALKETAAQVAEALEATLPSSDYAEKKLFEAMRLGALNGGKRLRPFLVQYSAKLFGVDPSCALRVGVALECLHSYSLVHDDLPAMDDSDLRRGQPTVHKVFDDATAILAGDGLLTYAFELLADPAAHEDPHVRCQLVSALAKAAGPKGMVGGQQLDLMAEEAEEPLDIGAITRLQRMKTGALISFACEAGAILGKASQKQRAALAAYANNIGLAFQIVDDLLDIEGTEESMGKPVQCDEDAGKATFVTILGVSRAKEQVKALIDQAIDHLAIFEGRATMLEEVARFIGNRNN